MLVARVVTGSFTSATTATGSGTPVLNYNTSESVIFNTISEGTLMNSTGSMDASGSLVSGSIDNIRW